MSSSKKYTTKPDQAGVVFGTLKNLDQQIQATELEQIGQGKKPEDIMGAGPDGEPLSYSGRIANLEAQKQNVISANQDLMSLVDQLHAREVEQQRQALEG